jgi:hypothetical protein
MGVYNMVVDIYSKTVWNNGTAPSLSKAQLDHIETGIKNNNTAIVSLQSVQVECENYASEALASKIASASSATASASSALSALVSANTAKTEADRAVAVAGVDIATDLVAGLVRGGGNVEVDANGDMNVPVANNLTTTVDGYALDARQGKVLNDSLTKLFQTQTINALPTPTGEKTYFVSNGGTTFPYAYGRLEIRHGSFNGEYVALYYTTGIDLKIYYNLYTSNGWKGWKVVGLTAI